MVEKVKKTFIQLSVKTDKSDIILRERVKSWIILYEWRNSTLRKRYLPRVPRMGVCVSVHTLRHIYAINQVFPWRDLGS